MLGPFLVGASMASESIWLMLYYRRHIDLHESMITDAPKKTYSVHYGQKWCEWQKVWLDGLRGLKERRVYALVGFDEFKAKFKRPITLDKDNLNRKVCFDAGYGLGGQMARNILDWERRHLLIEASNPENNLELIFVGGDKQYPPKLFTYEMPTWYKDDPTESDFQTELTGRVTWMHGNVAQTKGNGKSTGKGNGKRNGKGKR